MAHTEPHGPAREPAGHETSDVNLGGVERLLVGMIVFLGLVSLLVWFLYGQFREREEARDQPLPPIAAAARAKDARQGLARFPTPRLQTVPNIDLGRFRAAEDHVLNSYAWVDKQAGVAQVPVSRAIDIAAEHGLPSIAAPPAQEPAAATPAGSAPAAAPGAGGPAQPGAPPAQPGAPPVPHQ